MDPQVTSGAEWRRPREQGYLLTLPSGKVARLRPVDFSIVAKSGKIPDFLTPIVEVTLSGANMSEEKVKDHISKIGVTQILGGQRQLYEIIAEASFVEPKIVKEPSADNEISVEDLDGEDLGFVFEVAKLPANELRFLSEQQAAGVESVGNSEQSSSEAQPDVGAAPVAEPTAGG